MASNLFYSYRALEYMPEADDNKMVDRAWATRQRD